MPVAKLSYIRRYFIVIFFVLCNVINADTSVFHSFAPQITEISVAPLRNIPVHNIVSPDWNDSGIVVHHALERCPADWKLLAPAMKYIMAYTPYRSPLDENPHVAFSADGFNWTEQIVDSLGNVFGSIPNPIWKPSTMSALPEWSGIPIVHLSDPDVWIDENDIIWVVFRVKIPDTVVTAKYQIVLTRSEDLGLTWYKPTILLDTDQGDPVKGGMWSPAVWRDSLGVYRMLGVYTNAYGIGPLDQPNTIAIWRCLGPSPNGIWIEDTVLSDYLPTDTATRDWWHPEILRMDDGSLLMLMTTCEARGTGGNARLFLATSNDNGLSWDSLGQVFAGDEFPWTSIKFAYRAGATHRYTERGEAIDVWLSAIDTSIVQGESVRTGRFTLLFEPPCDTANPCTYCCEIPGNADNNQPSGSVTSAVNIGDVTFLINRIFLAGPAPECSGQADANGNGSINIGDVTYLISYIFNGGPSPQCPEP